MAKKPKAPKEVEALTHEEAKRRNIPTAELEPVMTDEDKTPKELRYPRNTDLDPQLVWRGKDEQDWSDLVVHAPPLYIQEKVHPKVLIDDLLRRSKENKDTKEDDTPDLFADFNGLADKEAVTEFYQHDQHWSNRMILGDSLQVMASLAEREGLRGQVQCIYLDPPYGIKFNSNFQWSTTTRDVKDGKADHITREPEQVRAFRDTWRDGIHSYLTYLRDRLTLARDLLSDSGSIFVQIGDENVNFLKSLLEEVFGQEQFASLIAVTKTAGGLDSTKRLPARLDYILWFAKDINSLKYRSLYERRQDDVAAGFDQVELANGEFRRLTQDEALNKRPLPEDSKLFRSDSLTKPGPGSKYEIEIKDKVYDSGKRWWGSPKSSIEKLIKIGRVRPFGNTLRFIKYLDDFPYKPLSNLWDGLVGARSPIYVVQTNEMIVQRCLLMATDPGDLVVDPTCGSGTTAYVAEQWGRRWITMDTSRVALALARSRLMGAKYPYYYLIDSIEGRKKEALVSGCESASEKTRCDVRQGFVYERALHITLNKIANNLAIDNVLDEYHDPLYTNLSEFNRQTGLKLIDWEMPVAVDTLWPAKAKVAHKNWWTLRRERQEKINHIISKNVDSEYLYDKPYVDSARVRVAGPFTVESLSPHRVLTVDENDELLDDVEAAEGKRQKQNLLDDEIDFAEMVIDNLRTAGVQQADKLGRIKFISVTGWPGKFIAAEGRYQEGDDGPEKKAAIFIGPEFGTVIRADLVAAAREAADCQFDILIACAFNFDAHSAEVESIGKIPVLKARMNPDLHMADELKNTGAGNLFVVFGEPDIDIEDIGDDQLQVKIHGVDVFHPQTGEIVSDGTDKIACWFIDTDYNEESFFVRHAYFLGANDPYKSLKTSLKAEIDEDAWATLHSDVSRPFHRPKNGRIAVKVINHLGDEVMKVFGV